MAVKLLVIAAVIWGVYLALKSALASAWSQLPDYHWHFDAPWLVVAVVVYFVGMIPAALFWYLVLQALGQDVKPFAAFRAYCVGHVGKYSPGKAMVVVMRTGMVSGNGVSAALAAASVFVETLTMMAVGSFVAAAILVIWFRDAGMPPYVLWGAFGMMVVAGLPTAPPVFRFLARLMRLGGTSPENMAKLHSLGYGTMLIGWVLMTLMWVLWGISYWATLKAMEIPGLDPVGALPQYVGTVSLATVAGFAVLVMPGGAGVREAALAALIIPYLSGLVPNPELIALASAIVLRVVWLVADVLVSIILYPMGWKRRT